MRHDFLILFKGDDTYIFRYESENVDMLFSALEDYGKDERLNLTSAEVSRLISAIKEKINRSRKFRIHTKRQE